MMSKKILILNKSHFNGKNKGDIMTNWIDQCNNCLTWNDIWNKKKENISNWEKVLTETSQMTLDWLAIKERLNNNKLLKDKNIKIQIGTIYYYQDENYEESYPLFLNINENYYHSFRMSKDNKYNSSRSIHDLIIYKTEWKDTMFIDWDYELLKTFKYLLFDNKDDWSEYILELEFDFRG